MDAKETLAYWIVEREKIRLARLDVQPKPWSNDPIFQKTYFCNVRREDDRVTRWIRSNWSPEKIGWDDYEYAMVVARFLNWPDTLARLTHNDGMIYLPDPMEDELEDIAKEGKKVWGNAYVVTTHGLHMGKAQYLCQRVLPAAYDYLGAGRWRNQYRSGPPTLAYHHERLMGLEGLASFMAAQVIADLKNTPGHPLYEATDWYSWSAPGPGSMRGLRWFHGEEIKPHLYRGAIEAVADYLTLNHPEASAILGERINMQDLQNCLCEYDKYMRIKNGTGRSKRSYPGVG